jgi:hypothetical protein
MEGHHHTNKTDAMATVPTAQSAWKAFIPAAGLKLTAAETEVVAAALGEVLDAVCASAVGLGVVGAGVFATGATVVLVCDAVPPPEEGGALPPPLGGGGFASAALTSAPVPHGIGASLPGCVFSVGGVVFPSASAMANRVVQVRFPDAGELNW